MVKEKKQCRYLFFKENFEILISIKTLKTANPPRYMQCFKPRFLKMY